MVFCCSQNDIYCRLGINLVQGSVFFGWFVRFEVQLWRLNLCLGGSSFGIFRFIQISNGKFTHFLIFYAVRTIGSVQGLVFFKRFGGSKFSFRGRTLGAKGSSFGFLKVCEVRGSIFSGSFQV